LSNTDFLAPTVQSEEGVASGIKEALAVGGALAERRIHQADEDVIDVISMLFEFILEDPSLPDAMRALLARLQIPMLKVAILDKTFFSRTEHPARRLLNTLAQAAVGWTSAMGRESSGLYGHIESIVHRILTEFDDDTSLFEELNQSFAAFLEGDQKGAGIAEQRAAQVAEGKERLGGAKHAVDDAIKNALAGNTGAVPQVVVDLLHEGWKGVMLTILLREGAESSAWTDVVATMDQLVWSVLPKSDAKERQALLKAIPLLLKRLRLGLTDIAYDQHKMASAFKSLQACHVKCLRSHSATPKPQKTQPKPTVVPSTIDEESGFSLDEEALRDDVETEEIVLETSVEVNEPEVPNDRYTVIAENMQCGTWIEHTDGEGDATRSKLSWRSGITGVCLFVNRKGIKVAEVTPQGLAAWFRGGNAVVLEEAGVPLMDRALSAVVDVLNREVPVKK